MSNSLPAHTSDDVYVTMEITNPTTLQVESASRRQPNADALCGSGGHDNIIFRMASQYLSIRNRISEDVARSELEAMERDDRYSFFFQDQ